MAQCAFNITGFSQLANKRVLSISISDQMGLKSDKCTITLDDRDFNSLNKKILDMLSFIFKLRTPNPNQPFKLRMMNSWGMCHKKLDRTKNHIHAFADWSGAFYFTVPKKVSMSFPDFNSSVELEKNMLILFQSYTKHGVDTSYCEESRLSMAFNIVMES